MGARARPFTTEWLLPVGARRRRRRRAERTGPRGQRHGAPAPKRAQLRALAGGRAALAGAARPRYEHAPLARAIVCGSPAPAAERGCPAGPRQHSHRGARGGGAAWAGGLRGRAFAQFAAPPPRQRAVVPAAPALSPRDNPFRANSTGCSEQGLRRMQGGSFQIWRTHLPRAGATTATTCAAALAASAPTTIFCAGFFLRPPFSLHAYSWLSAHRLFTRCQIGQHQQQTPLVSTSPTAGCFAHLLFFCPTPPAPPCSGSAFLRPSIRPAASTTRNFRPPAVETTWTTPASNPPAPT